MSPHPKDKVMIICYSFPPHPGIGGRRWAKFSKMLSKKGYEVFVVGANNLSDQHSFWSKDVDRDKIKINSFDFQFQKIIKYPSSILDKIVRKLILAFLNTTKYNPSIITSLPNKHIWQHVKETIVKEKIERVIVSGDPYLFYYASKLKQEIDFDLILDYRDLWNDHTFYETKVKLSPKQKAYFETAENFAVNNCNKIIFVDEYLQSVVKKRIAAANVSTFVIHNGFDKDDLEAFTNDINENDKINIFFAGSISSDLNSSLIDFVSGFENLAMNNPALYNKFSIKIFGEMDAVLAKEIAGYKLSNLFIKNQTLGLVEYYKELRNADVGFVILSDEYKNSFVTKFTDYLFYDKYIVSLGFKGYFTEYIVKHKIGMAFDSSDPVTFFHHLLQSCMDKKSTPIEERDKFDLDLLTEKLISTVIEN